MLEIIDIVEAAIKNSVVQMIEENRFDTELSERLGNLLNVRAVLIREIDPLSKYSIFPLEQNPWPVDSGVVTFSNKKITEQDIIELMNKWRS